jgi:hypothetical protein
MGNTPQRIPGTSSLTIVAILAVFAILCLVILAVVMSSD